MNVYLFANFHHYDYIISAYLRDLSDDKFILCDKNMRHFVSKTLNSKTKIYDLRFLRFYIIFSPIIHFFTPRINLFIQSRMGQQNLVALALYKVDKVFVINKGLDDSLKSVNSPKLSFANIKLTFSKLLLRSDLRFYTWEHVMEPGIENALALESFKLCDLSLYKVKHDYDCIVLDFSEKGLDLTKSLPKIKNELSQYKNVAIKKHPMEELGIGRFLDYDRIIEAIPVELYDSDKVKFYYLTSAAVTQLTNKINIYKFLEFSDRHRSQLLFDQIKREREMYGV